MVLNNKYLRHLTQLTCFCCLKCYSNLGRVPMFVIHTKNQPLGTSPVSQLGQHLHQKSSKVTPFYGVYIYTYNAIIENKIIYILKQQSS